MKKTQVNITKQDLKAELTIVRDEMGLMQKGLRDEMGLMKQDLEEQMSVMEESLDGKNRKYKDEILTGLDKVVKELETMREENTVGTFQI